MAYNESRKKASIEYAKRSLKRIPLDVQKEKYDEIKACLLYTSDSNNGRLLYNLEYHANGKPYSSRNRRANYLRYITLSPVPCLLYTLYISHNHKYQFHTHK